VASADTIAALASAPGRGALAIIRISGPDVARVAAALFGPLPPPRRAELKRFLDADGTVLDEGLVLYFPEPHSFTGEAVLELHGHGGPVVLDMLMQRLLALGCRAARPGEFSERAFLNGKIDMTRAEAVADLIDAGSAAAARAAVRSLRGEFAASIAGLQRQLTELRTLVEAAIDFPDEEIDFASNATLRAKLAQIYAAFASIGAAARQGSLLREGLQVVIAGRPNAGKSSLLNRLAGDEVAIVSELPGTTRDVLRQGIEIDGLPLHLIDTAGLRSAGDAVEAEGVRRAHGEIGKADVLLYIIDAARATPDERRLPAELLKTASTLPTVLIFNKIDLSGAAAHIDTCVTPAEIHLSAKTGAGLDLLRAELKRQAGYQPMEQGALGARRRHLDALARARGHVLEATEVFQRGAGFELFAEDLRLAQRALGEITGEFTSDDLLAEIFSSFCIGK
jgi:tRNA modification GTPase